MILYCWRAGRGLPASPAAYSQRAVPRWPGFAAGSAACLPPRVEVRPAVPHSFVQARRRFCFGVKAITSGWHASCCNRFANGKGFA